MHFTIGHNILFSGVTGRGGVPVFHREIFGDKSGKMRHRKWGKIENVEENEKKWNRKGRN